MRDGTTICYRCKEFCSSDDPCACCVRRPLEPAMLSAPVPRPPSFAGTVRWMVLHGCAWYGACYLLGSIYKAAAAALGQP